MEEITKIPNREEIPVEDTWATEDMYPSDEAWEAELATLEDDKALLSGFAGHLSDSAEKLLDYLINMERVDSKADLLGNYCMRKADQDTREAKYQAMSGKFMSAVVSLGAAVSFETPEILAISDETLAEFYAVCPGLERYRRYLTNLRRRKDHVLSPSEEKLLAAAGEISQAPSNTFGMFSNADLTFPDALDSQGKAHPISQGTYIACQESPDRVLRKNSFESLYHTYARFKNTAASLLDSQNKQLKFFAEARNFPNAFEASLFRTQVPTSVYRNLIDTVHKNLDKMHRYVALRKKLLGLEELHFYDIYTPLVQEADKKIPFAEAKQTVYDALAPLGEDYRKILKEGFDNRWIDVYQNVGKRSGAYSAGAPIDRI